MADFTVSELEHFHADRRKLRSAYNGIPSPAHSAHGVLIRTSLRKLTTEKKAIKVRFYRNGDRLFKGITYAVSPERFRNFEALMADLTRTLADQSHLPQGVRQIFTADGSRRIRSLHELLPGESYVCASQEVFKKLDYTKNINATWSHGTPRHDKDGRDSRSSSPHNLVTETSQEESRAFIKPKLVTVIKSGSKPRKAARILLNKKTAHSFDQVLTDITDAIKLDSGAVRKLYTMNGKQVTSLQDFFKDDEVFIAYGQERYSQDDFDLGDNEFHNISAYHKLPRRDRVMLKSPASSRRNMSPRLSTGSSKVNGTDGGRTKTPEHPFSPKLYRNVQSRIDSGRGKGSNKSAKEALAERKNSIGSQGSPVTVRAASTKKKDGSSASGSRSSSSASSKYGASGKLRKGSGPANIADEHLQNDVEEKRPRQLELDAANEDIQNIPPGLIEKYKIGRVIGDGNFAVVKECTDRSTGEEFALKIIDKKKCKGKEKMIESEVSVLRDVKHPNIIQLLDEYDGPNHLYLLMELVKGGDLFDSISMATKYTERDASCMVHNLASAINYLHSLNIVHRDIKPENLLVCEHRDGTKSLKLGDFGLATFVMKPLTTVCGTPTYVAPEIILETGYGVQVDVWAAGVITYILLCGFPPFRSENNDQEELFDKIIIGNYTFISPFWDDISNLAKELIMCMLEIDPEKRYTALEVMQHPWVAEDGGIERDFPIELSKKLSMNFDIKPKQSMKSAGIALVAATSLDKDSKYFKPALNRMRVEATSEDEENGNDVEEEDDSDDNF
ncbi:serine/threonine-protein kinase DCLK1-like [Anneissia japonica]|uniref:serine/threonine-protein kinase DCLK1-like n=1 Tax=Anneissia japonica TaxID=1529436 RepID=UPI00142574BC|nr:serine/threonine-protein kinase DCLK1-like [Anneissia japonica]